MNRCRPAIHGFHEKDRVCKLKKGEKVLASERSHTHTQIHDSDFAVFVRGDAESRIGGVAAMMTGVASARHAAIV
jgi:hypothetical protein